MKDRRHWEPLQPATQVFDSNGALMMDPPETWINRLYIVTVKRMPFGDMVLSIKPRDGSHRHDWREFQWIKNEIAGEMMEGVELYPDERRLVDTANQFFIYVPPPGYHFPFGFRNREVSEVRLFEKSTQRTWPPGLRPPDLLSREQLEKDPPANELFHTPDWHGAVAEQQRRPQAFSTAGRTPPPPLELDQESANVYGCRSCGTLVSKVPCPICGAVPARETGNG